MPPGGGSDVKIPRMTVPSYMVLSALLTFNNRNHLEHDVCSCLQQGYYFYVCGYQPHFGHDDVTHVTMLDVTNCSPRMNTLHPQFFCPQWSPRAYGSACGHQVARALDCINWFGEPVSASDPMPSSAKGKERVVEGSVGSGL